MVQSYDVGSLPLKVNESVVCEGKQLVKDRFLIAHPPSLDFRPFRSLRCLGENHLSSYNDILERDPEGIFQG